MDDEECVLLMMDREEGGLRHLIDTHGPKIKGHLKKTYGNVLSPMELNEAFFQAVQNVWDKIDSFDEKKGRLGPWFLTIACNCAVDVVRRESKFTKDKETAKEMLAEGEVLDLRDGSLARRIKKECREAIAQLPPMQKAIIEADLVADDGLASAARLAEQHSTSAASIIVSRHKAKATLKVSLTAVVEKNLGRKK